MRTVAITHEKKLQRRIGGRLTKMLNAQRLGLMFWSWLLCVTPGMCVQQPSDPGGPDLPKIRRYLSLEMYGEAAAALNPAVKADEFNG